MVSRQPARIGLIVMALLLTVVVAVALPPLLGARDREKMAQALTGGNPRNAPSLLRQYGCAGCHTIPSLRGADGKVGPPLTEIRARVYIAGHLPNTADNLIRFVVSPQSMVPGTAMPDTGLNEAQAHDVAAYLYAH